MRRLGLLLALPTLLSAAHAPVRDVTRDMSLTTPDGFVLKGTLTVPGKPGPRPVVVLAHQFQSNRAGWKVLVDDLNARGIATLALDLRGHGESTRKGDATVAVTPDFKASSDAVGFDRIPADIAQAAQWVRKQPRIDGHRLGLAGASVGAYSVLVAAPLAHPMAVLAMSPGGGWGEGPEKRIARAVETAKVPVFVMASQDDPQALANANAIKGVFGVYARIVPGKDHGFDYFPAVTPIAGGWFGEILSRHAHAATPKTDVIKVPAEEVK